MVPGKILKYQIIEEDILNDIKSGNLKPGDKVKSESALKSKYGVSAITVRKAFNDLIARGYLVGIQGLGTFVAKKQMIRSLTDISFSKELLDQGYEISLEVDDISVIVSETIAEILNLNKNAKIVKVSRIRFANNEPVAYHTSYISEKKLNLKAAKQLEKIQSFYKLLSKNYIYPAWVNENYSVSLIKDKNIAKLMNLKLNDATFFVKRIAFDDKEEVVEYCETYFNKDWYSVTVNIRK